MPGGPARLPARQPTHPCIPAVKHQVGQSCPRGPAPHVRRPSCVLQPRERLLQRRCRAPQPRHCARRVRARFACVRRQCARGHTRPGVCQPLCRRGLVCDGSSLGCVPLARRPQRLAHPQQCGRHLQQRRAARPRKRSASSHRVGGEDARSGGLAGSGLDAAEVAQGGREAWSRGVESSRTELLAFAVQLQGGGQPRSDDRPKVHPDHCHTHPPSAQLPRGAARRAASTAPASRPAHTAPSSWSVSRMS
jgi:hypothetical protein